MLRIAEERLALVGASAIYFAYVRAGGTMSFRTFERRMAQDWPCLRWLGEMAILMECSIERFLKLRRVSK